ncbi:helix-turn-helix domain-containing protein [Streptomyces sp. cf124]|uniref:helix-turn-helix domain-containing protein n=1 Tax=Streptomyces sp. cf124 TaxID=1761903 RepID=UPI001C432B4C|nr:helix-turn-helix domain-containing protein [Streptomyces sp. cf124]
MFVLVRRVDLADVIGAALLAKASGAGARSIAVRLGRPVDTVRGWLRRFEQRAEHVRVYFTVLLVDTGVDPVPPAVAATPFAAAVSAVVGAWQAALSRWPDVGKVSPWQLAVAASQGRLLSPSWP